MSDLDTLEKRVIAFNTLQLPGQPQAAHIGTFHLVNELWEEVERLTAERDELRDKLAALERQEPKWDYFVLNKFANDNAISYNKLCTMVKVALLAAGTAPVPQPVKWTPEEIARGNVGIRWVAPDGIHGRPTEHDVRAYLANLPETAFCGCDECEAWAASVPKGWKLVPIEPLPEMSTYSVTGVHWQTAERIYAAMLEAAPEWKPMRDLLVEDEGAKK